MDRTQKRELERQLREMTAFERQKLQQRALKLRKTLERGKRRDDDNRRRASVHDVVLDLLADDAAAEATAQAAEGEPGTVVQMLRPDLCHVRTPTGVRPCAIDRALAIRADGVTVGDEVLVRDRGHGHFDLAAIRPRRTRLSRPDPQDGRRERVIVANVDVVVIVAAVRDPPLRPGLVDRYLVAIGRGGAEPVLAVNKADLLAADADDANDASEGDELECLADWRGAGVPVVVVSASTGAGIAELDALLAGRTCAFVGHSGVGKSSLVRALFPDAPAATGEISESTGKGRHTTTTSTVHERPDGTRLIDTPGIRAFGLWDIGLDHLRSGFPDLDAIGQACRYRDCRHRDEPACAVRLAVDDGIVAAGRYASWVRLLDEIA